MDIRLLGLVSAHRSGRPIALGPRRQRFVLADAGVEPGEAQIGTRGGSYILRADPEQIDVHRFHARLRQAAQLTGDDQKIAALTEALDLWSGPPLSGAAPEEVQRRLCRVWGRPG